MLRPQTKNFHMIRHFGMNWIFFYPYRNSTDSESESGLSTDFKRRKIPEAKYNWKLLLY